VGSRALSVSGNGTSMSNRKEEGPHLVLNSFLPIFF
jgi:hypothetical protein